MYLFLIRFNVKPAALMDLCLILGKYCNRVCSTNAAVTGTLTNECVTVVMKMYSILSETIPC